MLFLLGLLLSFDVNDKCLANAVYHEARGESLKGQLAVARVTVNRLYHPEYPNTICKVVFQKGQYSWTALLSKRQIKLNSIALVVAKYARYERYVINVLNYMGYTRGLPLKNATSFSSIGFRNKRLKYIKKIGAHKFYKIKKVEF